VIARLALLLLMMAAASPAAAQDYAREKRWADEVVPGLVVGDAVWLETSVGRKFLAIHAQAANAKGAVVIVHGIGEHSGRYLHVGAHLADAGYHVVAFDNRGFGQSGGRRAFVESFDRYLDDVEDVLATQRALGVPVVLLGHSLGGLISATYLASDRPLPDLAVLSAPALHAEVPRWQRVLAPLLGRIAPKLFIASKIDGSLLSRDAAVHEAYLNDPLVIAGATARLGAETFTAMAETSAAIARISVPTYVLHGDADRLVPLAASDGVAALAVAERRVWNGLRHECFNEPEQAEVLAELTAWLDAQTAPESAD
jgi:alpha-beta hydrolase superfamily lysophospholipase